VEAQLVLREDTFPTGMYYAQSYYCSMILLRASQNRYFGIFTLISVTTSKFNNAFNGTVRCNMLTKVPISDVSVLSVIRGEIIKTLFRTRLIFSQL
jgi:hypothetical protein